MNKYTLSESKVACDIGYLQDRHGAKSSKRLLASVLIGIGTFIALATCSYGLFFPIRSAEFIKSIVEVCILSGCGLELGGIADNFKGRK
jgi:hypothetical protein